MIHLYDNPEKSELDILAYHEAAHAVMSYLLGYSLGKIEINSDEISGACWSDCRNNVRPVIPELQGIAQREKRIIINCAGYASESLLIGAEPDWCWSSDYHASLKELTPAYGQKIAQVYIELVTIWAKEISSKYWAVIEALADALVWYSERNRF